MTTRNRTTKAIAAGVLVLGGFGAGAALALTGSASAAGTVGQAAQKLDPTKSIRPDEHLLSGTTASKVRAAALAKYPGATIQRVETDSEGVYEAHIVTTDGQMVIVQVGKDFAVTGTQTGGPGGPGGPGGDAPPAQQG